MGSVESHPAPGSLVWEIASITKVFTGVLLAEMSLRGEVDLNDPIGEYLPHEVNARLPAKSVQPALWHLSTHTSGLPGIPKRWYGDLKGNSDPYAEISADQVFAELGPTSSVPAQQRSRYSNFGVGLLGLLLGRAVNSTYDELVITRILNPLGLSSTGFGSRDVVVGVRRGKPTPPWNFKSLGAAGALRSTASDMLAFASAVCEPPQGILGDALIKSFERRNGTAKSGIGLGWQIRNARWSEGDVIWHNGGTYGTSSFLAVHRRTGVAVVAFGNRGPGMLASPLDRACWKLLRECLR